MGTITILRPSATSSGVGWTATPSGTLNGVTSDDSDTTYALWSGTGSALILATPPDAPPAGERRHQVRLRMRGEDGDAWGAVRLASGGLVAGAAAQFPANPATITGAWGFGAPADGSTVLSCYVTGQTTGLKIEELYLDVDTRLAPDFTLSVLDGGGVPSATISDTAQPTISAGAINLDALAPRQFRYWVTLGGVIVWDSGIVSGPATNQQTPPLDNGAYVAHAQIWSTLGANTAYPSAEETFSFTLSVGAVEAPDAPQVIQISDTPFFKIDVCAPLVDDFDDGHAWIEIQRVDCDPGIEGMSAPMTSVAILGPLATDECADYTDYSLPRSGMGATCDHPGEQCCSYYRARTVGRVDGSIQVSAWSDSFNTGLPSGLVFAWPSTEDSIPAGWNRVADLDGRYPKGIASTGTQPGVTGGQEEHGHPIGGHSHSTSHTHNIAGVTSGAVGTVASDDGVTGTTAVLSTHTHAVNSPSTTPNLPSSNTTMAPIDPIGNDPARIEVVWIESDGTPAGVPDGALGYAPDISLSGWTDHADSTGRFLKGAPSGSDGGTVAASALDNHVHAMADHTHTDANHTHPNNITASAPGNRSLFAGPNSVTWTSSHNHPITMSTTAGPALSAGGAGDSDVASLSTEPPFVNTRVKQNTSGEDSLPVGLIGLWRGSLGTIPSNWALCDGTGGTPDMIGVYPKGATASIGTTGGSLNPHEHTSGNHTHAAGAHSHTMTIGVSAGGTAAVSATATVTVARSTHTHTHGDTSAATPTVSTTSSGTLEETTTEPPHEQVAFVQLIQEPVPPTGPDEMCLTWNDDEHLIRTTGPDGPMFVALGGEFTWDRDRPFTASMGVMGKRFVTSNAPGGRNLHLTTAMESESALKSLLAVLNRPLVFVSPSDANEVWAAPVSASVKVVKIGRIRQVTADFIATGPQPEPQLADVGD